jgi:hypothetical protein
MADGYYRNLESSSLKTMKILLLLLTPLFGVVMKLNLSA